MIASESVQDMTNKMDYAPAATQQNSDHVSGHQPPEHFLGRYGLAGFFV